LVEDFAAEHQKVLTQAMNLFKAKSSVRGQMWLEWPPSDKIREMRERIMRIEAAYANRERLIKQGHDHEGLDRVIIEDGIDLINYTDFLIKQIERGMSG
jgi:hypothetical protein